MGWSPELSARVTHEKPSSHTSGLRLVLRGDGKGDSSTNQARSRMAQGWQGSSLLSLPDLPERVLRSFFLHLYLITRSGPVLKAEASWRTPQSVPPPPPPASFRRRGTSVAGPRGAECCQPSHQGALGRRLWERSGSFQPSEERVSTGCEPKYALFVEKHFLINQPVFDMGFTETTAFPRAGKCDCGSS